MHVRTLGATPYLPIYQEMQAFTARRTPDTPDELWICEHPPVFTLGLNGQSSHLLLPGDKKVRISSTSRLLQELTGTATRHPRSS